MMPGEKYHMNGEVVTPVIKSKPVSPTTHQAFMWFAKKLQRDQEAPALKMHRTTTTTTLLYNSVL
jgi:hypothetical protein